MKSYALVTFALLLMAGPALAQKVFIDYDQDYDFETIETFAWIETSETSMEQANSLMHSRIVNAVEHHLSMAGLREVGSDPDIYVTYHTSTEKNLSFDTTAYGYGYPGGWRGGYYRRYGYGAGFGTAAASTTVSTYQTGTLLVDAWDARTEKLVWRGVATNMTVYQNPEKMAGKIDKALKKIIGKWQKLKRSSG
jgi:hypothetical protein